MIVRDRVLGPGGSLVIVSAAVVGSTSIFALTTMQSQAGLLSLVFSRSNGPGLRGVDDRQAERRTLVWAGDVHLAALHGVRVTAQPDADGRFPDQAFGAAGAFVRLRFAAQPDTRRESPRAPAACAAAIAGGSAAVLAAHRHRERRERHRPGCSSRSRRQCGANGNGPRTGAAVRARGDLERRGGRPQAGYPTTARSTPSWRRGRTSWGARAAPSTLRRSAASTLRTATAACP